MMNPSQLEERLLASSGNPGSSQAAYVMEPPGPVRISSTSDGQGPQEGNGEQDPTCWESCCMCCGAPTRGPSAARAQVKAAPNLLALDLASQDGVAFAQLAGGLWVSHILQRLWPHVATTVENMVQDMVPAIIEANTPKWMEGVSLEKFDLGNRPPTVLTVHVDQVDDDNVAEVRLHLELEWTSQSDIQLTVRPLPAALHKMMPSNLLQAMVQYMTSLSLGIQGLSIRAQVLLTLAPLIGEVPVVQAIHISMLRPPSIDYNITITKGESTVLNVVKPWLHTIITNCFNMYVMPEIVHVPIATGQLPVQKPEGAVLVRVVRASGVPKMDYWGHSDTYVDLSVRSRIRRRTPVVKKSASPEWPASDASFTLLVHARQYQSLLLELWDADEGMLDSADDAIGYCAISLAALQPGKEHALVLPVFNATVKDGSPLGSFTITQDDVYPMGPDAVAMPPLPSPSAQSKDSRGHPAPAALPSMSAGTAAVLMPHAGQLGIINAAHPCACSTADVRDTRLHVVARYVPALLAPLLTVEVGSPGVFNMKLSKVTVPDLAALPLRARAYVTGQRPVCNPPLSYMLRPLRGKDKVTGEELATRKEIPFWFDAVWDVLGSAAKVAECVCVLELVEGLNTQGERVVARVDMPLAQVIQRRIITMAGGVAGGDYKLKSDNGFLFDMLLLWGPLVADVPSSGALATEVPPALTVSATTPANSAIGTA